MHTTPIRCQCKASLSILSRLEAAKANALFAGYTVVGEEAAAVVCIKEPGVVNRGFGKYSQHASYLI